MRRIDDAPSRGMRFTPRRSSIRFAPASTRSSLPDATTICTPTGKPRATHPHGSNMPEQLCASVKSGCTSSTITLTSANRSAAFLVNAATFGSTGVMPKSAEYATRNARHCDRVAARHALFPGDAGDTGSRASAPYIASNTNAQSRPVRAIGLFRASKSSILAGGLRAKRPGGRTKAHHATEAGRIAQRTGHAA